MSQLPVPAGAASSSGAIRGYGLPAATDVAAWVELQLPFAGRLQLAPPPSRRHAVSGTIRRVVGRQRQPLPLVDVWLHSGLHYRRVDTGAGGTDAAPVPGQPLPSG